VSQEYRVAKKQVTAEVTIAGEKPAVLTLFLAEQTRQHAGDERPSDLLNGSDIFLPAIDRKKKLRLLQRDAVVVITVPAALEPGAAATDDGAASLPSHLHAEVEVVLQGGAAIRGTVEYDMPESRSRLIDFLNREDRCLAVRQADQVHLVNKRHIARVTELQE
jgi:hypothetical protein